MAAPRPPTYLSGTSANALISDLRPTTVSLQALLHINLFLDEILSSLIITSESLNPRDLRTIGVKAVFSGDKAADSTGPRALGRAAVGEAELELRSWYESHGGARAGFAPAGQGSGMKSQSRAFAKEEAVEVMRVKGVTLCTLAPDDPISKKWEEDARSDWKTAGGDAGEATLDPAGLWLTAVIEHVCEHVLAQMSRVVARDSSVAVASVQDLYTALCEDESVWGFFRRMAVKDLLESAVQAGSRQKRSNASESAGAGRTSSAHTTSAHGSKTSLALQSGVSDGSLRRGPSSGGYGSDLSLRGSSDTTRLGPVGSSGMNRSTSGLRYSSTAGEMSGERSPSVLSEGTRSMVGAAYSEFEGGSEDGRGAAGSKGRQQDEEDEFDALVRSGQTMKVSLTPSRLKTFDSGRRITPDQSTLANQSPGAKRDQRYQDAQQTANPSGFRTPPRSGVRPEIGSRTRSASSSQRMMARGAATIEEDEEEDGPVNAGRKESLKDIFSNGPGGASTSGSPGKRTVPAVVLGTPPPPPPNDSKPATPRQTPAGSINRATVPQVEHPEDDGLEPLAPKSKRRTEAQDLADFFSSTAPPPGSAGPVREDEPAASKPKGLKGLMSKITGSKKDSAWTSQQVKHQKSMPSISSPTGHTHRASGAAALLPLGAPVQVQPNDYSTPPVPPLKTAAREEEAGPSPLVTGGVVAASVAAVGGAAYATGSSLRRSTSSSKSARKPAPRYADDAQSSQPSSTAASLNGAMIDSVPEGAHVRDVSGSSESHEKEAINSVPEATSTIDALSPVSERSQDGDSFATANEGGSPGRSGEEGEAAEQMLGEDTDLGRKRGSVSTVVPRGSVDAGVQPGMPTQPRVSTTAGSPDPQAPSIALAELLPLRDLMQHASTPQECHMLLNAVLTQLGVPSGGNADAARAPEDRVAAWLLAGARGPE